MKIERRTAVAATLVVLAVPMAAGLSSCGEDNPARDAFESQKQKLQDQANEAINRQTEQATKQAQDALERAKQQANDAVDQAQQQLNESIPANRAR